MLENASLNEVVRSTLSDKHKIKDLFLVVCRSVDIKESMKLLASLVQFVSNLCYGTGKFRTKLANEPPSEFMEMIGTILIAIEESLVNKEDKSKTDWT